jgi:Flp pilus assembly protein TadG
MARVYPPHPSRRGVAALELAVCLPFFVISLLGVWEVGRFLDVQQTLDNSAREGGRQASTGKKTNAQVVDSVYQNLVGANQFIPSGSSVVSADVLTGVDIVRTYTVTKADKTKFTFTVGVSNITGSRDAAAANQLDVFRVSITYPTDAVRWLTVGKYVANGTNLTAKSEWCSMADVPLTVSSTIPTKPQ